MLARTVSKVTGYTVVLIDSSNVNNGKTVNGRKAIGEFNSTKGEIVLDIGSDNVVATALHEVTHYAKSTHRHSIMLCEMLCSSIQQVR